MRRLRIGDTPYSAGSSIKVLVKMKAGHKMSHTFFVELTHVKLYSNLRYTKNNLLKHRLLCQLSLYKMTPATWITILQPVRPVVHSSMSDVHINIDGCFDQECLE